MTDSGGGKVRYFCADTLKKGRYEYMHGIEFFTFPTQKKDPKGMRAWIGLLRRKDYDPPGHHRVRYICKIPKMHRLTIHLFGGCYNF